MNARTALTLASIAVVGIANADFNFTDFSSTAGLNLHESAQSVDGALSLTTADNWNRGAVWTDDKQSVVNGFDTSFDYHIGEGNGADGLAFAIQGGHTWDIGGMGGSIGFDNLQNAYGVQFRTYSHNLIQTGTWTGDESNSVANSNLRGDHHVRITYNPGIMNVYFDGVQTLATNIDLSTLYGNSNEYIGFTSATGGSNDVHAIKNWSFKSGPVTEAVPEPATMAVLGLGALGLIRRRKVAKAA